MNDRKLARKAASIVRKHARDKPVHIRVEDRVVYLEGAVSSYEEYVRIGREAGRLKGVRGVVSRLSFPEKMERKRPVGKKECIGEADVVIVGGGVVGCSIARELSRYRLRVILVERAEDVACGTSKANNAMVHTGIGEKMGTLKQKLCVKGHQMYKKITDELQVPYEQQGLYIITTRDSFAKTKIPGFLGNFIAKHIVPLIILRRAKKLGLPMKRVSRKELLENEPQVTERALAAVYSPTYGITCPYLFTIALAENALANGVEVMLDTEVVDITVKDGTVSSVVTTRGTIDTSFVINAAGLYADEIADMAGAREYTIHPKKGATLLFDREASALINRSLSILLFPRTEHYKGGGLMKTIDGNLQWGPTMREVFDPTDTSVTAEEIQAIFARYSLLAPRFPKNAVIAYFSGLRAATFTEDFFIEASRRVKGFIHVAGIQSPGLAAAPAIAEMVLDILRGEGLELERKTAFNPYRKGPPVIRHLSPAERERAIAENPLYGKIVCRCEEVTEGEIVDAIRAPIPARSVDAIKRRTRAGMGRCQGGFCLPRVVRILSRETGIPAEKIVKNGRDSHLFVGKAKCLLEGECEN